MDEAKESNPVAKKAALATQAQESRETRAARFFAMNGMKKIGSMLGEELSAADEAKATREAADVASALHAPVAAPEAPVDSLDLEEDDEDAAAKKRWQAVDALRRRAPRV